MFSPTQKGLGRSDANSFEEGMPVDMNSLSHLPRRSGNNFDLQFANNDRQSYRYRQMFRQTGYAYNRQLPSKDECGVLAHCHYSLYFCGDLEVYFDKS